GIELIKDENKTPALEEAQRLRDLCREKGLLIGVGGVNGNVIRFQPPLVISKSELEKAFDILKECLKLLGED
ncbi:MAG: aminotransferase class III-fold pyridoxal phosphate-dependent enzyme, partial [Chloroflexi bacterium]|nr:aminotransferase class III-fold pyridoxal phosphate-dependent enzyme [Chloroflexota bacterium]